MDAPIAPAPATYRPPRMRSAASVFSAFFAAVVIVQGVHVFEHIVQLAQVYVLGAPEDLALEVLGFVLQFQGTEEWLHLVFNVSYVLSLYVILLRLRRLTPRVVPHWAFALLAVGGVGLESWHVMEHLVIISNVIRNNGCPCPGIGDAALGISDVVLHFFYNLVAYAATLPAFWFVMRGRRLAAQRFSFTTRGV
jgi:hypothetical protein